jgi:uncharacterized membrane protein YdbT with pleckstrin-like domain
MRDHVWGVRGDFLLFCFTSMHICVIFIFITIMKMSICWLFYIVLVLVQGAHFNRPNIELLF